MMEVDLQVKKCIEALYKVSYTSLPQGLNIMYTSSLLAMFMHCPTNRHYRTSKRVLRYIKGILDYGFEYVKGKKACLIGYCDSDWGGSLEDNKSTLGYAFSIGSGVFA